MPVSWYVFFNIQEILLFSKRFFWKERLIIEENFSVPPLYPYKNPWGRGL